MALIGSKK